MYEENQNKKESVILIVDDTQKNIQLLGNILTKEGYGINIAENGREALEALHEGLPDLILMDVMMPEMDGHEACKILKDSAETKDIPVIFLTAKTETEDIVKGFDSGAVDYVTKPFNSTELLARVRTHLELKNSRDLLARQRDLLSVQNEELKKLNELKNELLGVAAHDIRSPIGTIMTTSSVILDFLGGNLTEKQIKFLKNILDTCNYMLKLLNDLLDLTAIESGKLKLEISKGNYLNFLKTNMEFNQLLADKKKISLYLEAEDNIPDIYFDQNKLTQVMNNLIGNAVKFSYGDTKITVLVKKNGNHIITDVKDEGQGIPEEDLPDIFKEFQRASVKPTGGEKSTGLGLAITKKIIKGHKGNIGVKSEVGKGSEFYFTLPLKSEE